MASFGWAYVDCSSSAGSGQAAGPVGSIQFVTGTNATSGSSKLVYFTGSEGGGHTASSLILSGNLVVTGTLSASVVNYENISIIDATGSTSFGNSNDDTHVRVGSLIVNKLGVGGHILSASTATEAVHVRGFNVLYEFVPATGSVIAIYTASVPSYIIGVRSTGSVKIEIPAASTYGSGALLLVKDEVGHLNGTDIRLSASSAGTYTIDGATNYILTGSNPAISLYSNGANWFVF
tara:strand:- start:747 stop:1451 length:705 start_codon:yes stop_codon:yes gene_type:complete